MLGSRVRGKMACPPQRVTRITTHISNNWGGQCSSPLITNCSRTCTILADSPCCTSLRLWLHVYHYISPTVHNLHHFPVPDIRDWCLRRLRETLGEKRARKREILGGRDEDRGREMERGQSTSDRTYYQSRRQYTPSAKRFVGQSNILVLQHVTNNTFPPLYHQVKLIATQTSLHGVHFVAFLPKILPRVKLQILFILFGSLEACKFRNGI